MKNLRTLTALAIVIASSLISQARAEDARVLPKGVSRLSVIYGQTAPITETFNANGQSESVTQPYNVELSARQIQTAVPQIADLVQTLNKTGFHYNQNKRNNGDHGLTLDPNDPLVGDALSRGFLDPHAEAHRQQYNFAYQYGLTQQLSVGIMAPYIKTQVHVSSDFAGANTSSDIQQGLAQNIPAGTKQYNQIVQGIQTISGISTEQLQDVLTSNGYSRFQDSETNGFGDLVFGGRYQYMNYVKKKTEVLGAFQLGWTAPTGHIHAPSEITGVDLGQGAWDMGASHIASYSPFSLITFTNSVHYTYGFWNSRDMRVRRDPGDVIPNQADEENTNKRIGDKYWTDLGMNVSLSKAVKITSGYEWYWKNVDRYSGNRTDRDYGYLSEGTDQYSETLQVGASVSSIPAFQAHTFPLPADLSFDVYMPRKGKNSIIAPYGTLALALYF